MSTPSRFVFTLCLLSLFHITVELGFAQDISLDNIKTTDDAYAYIRQEFDKLTDVDGQQRAIAFFEIRNAAGKKLLEVARHNGEKESAYHLQFSAHQHLIRARIEGAEQKMETFLDKLAAKEEFKSLAKQFRLRVFTEKADEVEITPEGFVAFKRELKQWFNKDISSNDVVSEGMRVACWNRQNIEQFAAELVEYVLSGKCTLPASEKERTVTRIHEVTPRYQFYEFTGKVLNNEERTPEDFALFKAELKQWMDRVERVYPMNNGICIEEVINLGLGTVKKYNVSAEQFVAEFIEYVSSESPQSTKVKADIIAAWEKALRTAVGSDPKLFGKMVDGKNFDWKSLRGKYVLIDFAFFHIDHNKRDMWEAYKQYHDKGLVIVSVYFGTHGKDPIANVKQYVKDEQIPWIVISDAQTTFGGLNRRNRGVGKLEEYYYFSGNSTPTLLVDKEGKIILTHVTDGEGLQSKLAEIFEQDKPKSEWSAAQ